MFKVFAVELAGTFVFLYVILSTGAPIPIAIGLLAGIYVSASVSGAHLNPAVSIMTFANRGITVPQLGVYVSAQILGGLLALAWFKLTTTGRKIHSAARVSSHI